MRRAASARARAGAGRRRSRVRVRARRGGAGGSDRARSPLPVILAIEDDRASTRADLDVLLVGATRGPLASSARFARSAGSNAATSSPTSCRFSPAEGDARRRSDGDRPGASRAGA